MSELKCPTCPACGRPPMMAMDVTQAFCVEDDCPVMTWNMTMTKDENLDDANFMDIKDTFKN